MLRSAMDERRPETPRQGGSTTGFVVKHLCVWPACQRPSVPAAGMVFVSDPGYGCLKKRLKDMLKDSIAEFIHEDFMSRIL